jgi:hypothetical protein
MLGEVIVHGEDIRRPLDIRRNYPGQALPQVAELYQARNSAVPSKKRSSGLRLVATDGPFSAGSGPVVRGTTLALIMAMARRAAYGDDLYGQGITTLRERCEPP